MMRSLYSGVSGLKTHQIKMDVIGNNIANVNTVAYKSQSITFTELMYQTTQKASGPNAATGGAGKNAKQIGLGVTSGAINTAITAQGSTQNTGNAFDLKITGESFFVVSNGSGNYFTRDGSFYVDAAGNLAMSSTGYNVMGWLPDATTGEIVQDSVKKLQILSAENLVSNPQATTQGRITGIIDRNDSNVLSATGKAMNFSFYDNLGYTYNARFNMKATDEKGVYILSLADVLQGKDSILDDFDASIFTGTNSDGSAVNAAKKNSYSVVDGYKIAADGTLTLEPPQTITGATTNPVATIKPSDFLGSDGKLKDSTDNTLALANAYASAFGFTSIEDFLNLTVDVGSVSGSVTNSTPTNIGSILMSGGTYTGTEPVSDTDPTLKTENLFVPSADGKSYTLDVDGFSAPAGTSIKVVYDQEDGTLTGLNGSGQITSFNFLLTPKNSGENPFEQITIDMSASLNLNNEKTSTIGATYGDKDGKGSGCALGAMTGVSIQNNGMIYGAYDNGQTRLLGQIAVANFSNAAGLEKAGDNLYAATLNSGEFDGIGVDVTMDGGSMSTGVLEMSNVDLSSEFTELITTQRGFQANSRIITVSDTLLEELVNLKR